MSRRLKDGSEQPRFQQQSLVQNYTSPECLSASVISLCHKIDEAHMPAMVAEFERQVEAVQTNDLSRAEAMLIAQAHTLDGLFAYLTSHALTAKRLDVLERYMRLALKTQNQTRATLQTLGELKAPRQVAFVKQANIGNQVQVNNGPTEPRSHTEKTVNMPNELLEVTHEQRLDTRAPRQASSVNPHMATVAKKQRPQ